MSKKPSGAKSLRLFVGVTLPPPIVSALGVWQAQAERIVPQLRGVRVEGLHFTLVFLGQTDEQAAREVRTLLGEIALQPMTLALDRVPAIVPPSGQPRLVAGQLRSGVEALTDLQANLARRLEAGHFFKPEARPYWPHITLARTRNPRRGEPPLRRVEGVPPLPEDAAYAFDPLAVTLFKSDLRPRGAVYTAIAERAFPRN